MQRGTTSKLKTYRRGDPLTCHRIWDVIKDLKVETRSDPTEEDVVQRYCKNHNVKGKYVKEQLKFLSEDQLVLLKTISIMTENNKVVSQNIFGIPRDSDIDLMEKSDWYCFVCHKPGEVINCNCCSLVFHVKCLGKFQSHNTETFICWACKEITLEPNVEDEDVLRELNDLIKCACVRLEEELPLEKYVWEQTLDNTAVTQHTPTDNDHAKLLKITNQLNKSVVKEEWREKFLLRFSMTVEDLIHKADIQFYKSLKQFQLHAAKILHNVIIFYGENSILADAARQMLQACIFESGEINLCRDCYKRSNEPEGPDWFCHPCNPPHDLVHAKVKGWPYWPAKVLSIKGNQYDVRFFGKVHDRFIVDKSLIKPIDVFDSPTPKHRSSWLQALAELKKHQKMLAAAADVSFNKSEYSNEKMDVEDENDASPPGKSYTRQILPNCIVLLKKFDYQAWLIENKERLEATASDSEMSSTEESVMMQDETTDCSQLVVIQDQNIFPETIETETAETVMMDFSTPASLNELDIELLAAKNKIAALKSKQHQQTECHHREILTLKERHQQEILSLKESQQQQTECHKEEILTIKERHQQEIFSLKKSQQQEKESYEQDILIRQESHFKSVIAQHKEEIVCIKTKVWCSNQCGNEGILHCCHIVTYCGVQCQREHWKESHQRKCRNVKIMNQRLKIKNC